MLEINGYAKMHLLANRNDTNSISSHFRPIRKSIFHKYVGINYSNPNKQEHLTPNFDHYRPIRKSILHTYVDYQSTTLRKI